MIVVKKYVLFLFHNLFILRYPLTTKLQTGLHQHLLWSVSNRYNQSTVGISRTRTIIYGLGASDWFFVFTYDQRNKEQLFTGPVSAAVTFLAECYCASRNS